MERSTIFRKIHYFDWVMLGKSTSTMADGLLFDHLSISIHFYRHHGLHMGNYKVYYGYYGKSPSLMGKSGKSISIHFWHVLHLPHHNG